MKKVSKKFIWISDEYQEYPLEEDGCMDFSIYVENECICGLTYEELLTIRDMINRIERRHNGTKGGEVDHE